MAIEEDEQLPVCDRCDKEYHMDDLYQVPNEDFDGYEIVCDKCITKNDIEQIENDHKVPCNGCGYPFAPSQLNQWHEKDGRNLNLCDACTEYQEEEKQVKARQILEEGN